MALRRPLTAALWLTAFALAAVAAVGDGPRMTDIPAPAWAAVGAIGGALVSQGGSMLSALLGRRPTRTDGVKADATIGDGVRADATYLLTRLRESEGENERLRERNLSLYERVQQLSQVNDAVVERSAQTRSEVSRALGTGDATPAQG